MNKYKNVVEVIVIFTVTFIYNIFFNNINNDEIWCFGFSYNIVNGLIPYVDYNMIIGPIYPYFNAFFMFLFGNNMLVFHIVNSIIVTFIFVLIKKINYKSYYIVFAFFLLFSSPHYNIFCFFFLYLFCYLEAKNTNNYIIGVLLGVLIFIKISVGLFLCIPSLFIKDKDKLFKRVIGCELFSLLMLLIMKLCGNLSGFLNYTVLGLFDFAESNLCLNNLMIISFFSIVIILYLLIFKKDKSIILFYLLCFQIIAYPIFDKYRVFICFIPVLGYLLNNFNLHVKTFCVSFYVFILFFFSFNVYYSLKLNKSFDDDSVLFKFRFTDYNVERNVKKLSNYIKEIDKNKKIYIFARAAYSLKLESGLDVNKYDLINNGNMGYMGEYVYLDEIINSCELNKCVFVIDFYDRVDYFYGGQTSKLLVNYVVDNYNLVDNLWYFEIYEN